MSRSKKLNKSECFIKNLEDNLFIFNEFKVKIIFDYLNEFDDFLKEKSLDLETKINAWEKSEKKNTQLLIIILTILLTTTQILESYN